MKALKTLLLTLATVALLHTIGCGGGGPAIELPADPATAPQATLESAFGQIEAALAQARPGSHQATELGEQKKIVGGVLAARAADGIRRRLAETPRVEGMIPLGTLEAELAATAPLARFDPATHDALAAEIEAERERTARVVRERERAVASLGNADILERLGLLAGLIELTGEGSSDQARYADQREELLASLSKDAEEAIRSEDFEKAQSLLGIVQEAAPDDEQARRKKCEVDGKVILKQISQALETGSGDRAMQTLSDAADGDCFEEIRSALQEQAPQLVEAFGTLGAEATANQNLGLAYHYYSLAQAISKMLLGRGAALPAVDGLLGQVGGHYEKAMAAGEFGVAWGLLDVMSEFGTTTPQMRQHLRMTRDEIDRRAVRGLTAYPFEDPKSSAAKVGDAVASKVVQHIFSTIPTDVRIVEREQLERILDECKRTGDCNELSTADFIVQGTINDAKVETTEKTGKETRRVLTGKETLPNPSHAQWLALSDRQRKKQPEPPATITRDVTEDVEFDVTAVRKVGIISVSYRVVEASSGRVVFTDSLQTRQEFQDEGRQGVQLGDFKQETDFIELPPDIEILSGEDGLADRISEAIGKKLVAFLENPEVQYEQDAKRFVEEGDYADAASRIAYAIALREAKSKEAGKLREQLRSYAMQSQGF